MPSIETKQMRRARFAENYVKRNGKRPRNNRSGQPAREMIIEKQAIGHFDRIKRLKARGGTPVCRPFREVAKEQDIRQGKRRP